MTFYRIPSTSIKRATILTIALLLFPTALPAEDTIEFLTGVSIRGKVTKIDKTRQVVHFESSVAGRKSIREFQYSTIHKVDYRGKKFVLNKRLSGSNSALLTPAEVLAKVAKDGSRDPDWLAQTELEHPKSLDLSWPIKPPEKKWNSQKNVGQYIWEVINPNTSRWKSGVRLVRHIMDGHQGNKTLVQRDRRTLGEIYFRLFQDYPRAAYWLQKGNVSKSERQAVILAECYWRMGSRSLGLDWLRSNLKTVGKIKLLGDMGETDSAISLANSLSKSNANHQAFLAAGDALRLAKRYDEAVKYYEKVIGAKPHKNKDYNNRFVGRARESVAAIRLFEQFDLTKKPDGTFAASSTGYNGALEVEVVVKNQRIQTVRVVKHREKQFYSAIADTTGQIIKSQDIRQIDGTTSATITSQAIVNATAKALGPRK